MSEELKKLIEEQELINRLHSCVTYQSESVWAEIIAKQWKENSDKIKALIEHKGKL